MPRLLGKQYWVSITMTITITAKIMASTMPTITPVPSPVLETFSLGSSVNNKKNEQ